MTRTKRKSKPAKRKARPKLSPHAKKKAKSAKTKPVSRPQRKPKRLPANRQRPIEANILIHEPIQPIDRGERYEDPVFEALEGAGLGGPGDGAGSLCSKEGEIEEVDFDVDLKSLDAVPVVIRVLQEHGAPKGSVLRYRHKRKDVEVRFGVTEGVAIYLDGVTQPREAYSTTSAQELLDRLLAALDGAAEHVSSSGTAAKPTGRAKYSSEQCRRSRPRFDLAEQIVITIRCTTKLLRRLGAAPATLSDTNTTKLGEWYATLLHTRRGQFVLAMARSTLLPVVVTGRDLRTFPTRVASTLAEVLAAYGVPVELIERECAAMSDVQYARTDDRSNVGVLTELQRLLHGDLEYLPTATLTELSLRLAQTPIVARNVFPEDETCRLFGVPLPRHREKEMGN